VKTITIAGAGPAGLAAAIHLRRSGFPVEVFERRDSVGARFIGDWHVLECYCRRVVALVEMRAIGIEP
jgi:flavin-dependent dehydrogenase